MMISSTQLNQLSSRILDSFSRAAAARIIEAYPRWQAESPIETRQQQVSEIMRYGQRLGLNDDEALYRFGAAVVEHNLTLPLSQPLLNEFRQPGISRAAQLENLILRLLSGRDTKILITL